MERVSRKVQRGGRSNKDEEKGATRKLKKKIKNEKVASSASLGLTMHNSMLISNKSDIFVLYAFKQYL